MSKYDEKDASERLYRVEFDGGFRHVIATSFGDAVLKWRNRMIADFGPGSGWDDSSEPETVSCVDDDEVIR